MLVNQANLTGIYTSFSVLFNQTLEVTKTMWEEIATLVPSSGSKNDYKWLGNFPFLREWIGERFIKSLAAFKYEVENRPYEATIEVDRDDVEDDQIGVYRPMIQGLAANAKLHPEKLTFDLLKNGTSNLCYDGKAFFATDHPVAGSGVSNYTTDSGAAWYLLDTSKFIKPLLVQMRKNPEFVSQDSPDDENVFMRKKFLYGVDYRGNAGYSFWQMAFCSKQTLNAANYLAARKAMMEFKNDEGVPLSITPNILVVSPANEGAARELLEAARNASGADNIWYHSAKIIVSPWLA